LREPQKFRSRRKAYSLADILPVVLVEEISLGIVRVWGRVGVIGAQGVPQPVQLPLRKRHGIRILKFSAPRPRGWREETFLPASLHTTRLQRQPQTPTEGKEILMKTNDAWNKGRDQARQGSGFSLPQRVYYPVREAWTAGYLGAKKSGK